MRILHKKFNFKKIVFSPISGLIYLFIFLYFMYTNMHLYFIWQNIKDRLEKTEVLYRKKLEQKKQTDLQSEIFKTEEGQERYRKEFFNELKDDEKLIILFDEKNNLEEKEVKEDVLEKNKIQEWKQKIKLWWANL